MILHKTRQILAVVSSTLSTHYHNPQQPQVQSIAATVAPASQPAESASTSASQRTSALEPSRTTLGSVAAASSSTSGGAQEPSAGGKQLQVQMSGKHLQAGFLNSSDDSSSSSSSSSSSDSSPPGGSSTHLPGTAEQAEANNLPASSAQQQQSPTPADVIDDHGPHLERQVAHLLPAVPALDTVSTDSLSGDPDRPLDSLKALGVAVVNGLGLAQAAAVDAAAGALAAAARQASGAADSLHESVVAWTSPHHEVGDASAHHGPAAATQPTWPAATGQSEAAGFEGRQSCTTDSMTGWWNSSSNISAALFHDFSSIIRLPDKHRSALDSSGGAAAWEAPDYDYDIAALTTTSSSSIPTLPVTANVTTAPPRGADTASATSPTVEEAWITAAPPAAAEAAAAEAGVTSLQKQPEQTAVSRDRSQCSLPRAAEQQVTTAVQGAGVVSTPVPAAVLAAQPLTAATVSDGGRLLERAPGTSTPAARALASLSAVPEVKQRILPPDDCPVCTQEEAINYLATVMSKAKSLKHQGDKRQASMGGWDVFGLAYYALSSVEFLLYWDTALKLLSKLRAAGQPVDKLQHHLQNLSTTQFLRQTGALCTTAMAICSNCKGPDMAKQALRMLLERLSAVTNMKHLHSQHKHLESHIRVLKSGGAVLGPSGGSSSSSTSQQRVPQQQQQQQQQQAARMQVQSQRTAPVAVSGGSAKPPSRCRSGPSTTRCRQSPVWVWPGRQQHQQQQSRQRGNSCF